jgi:hypothetical protein
MGPMTSEALSGQLSEAMMMEQHVPKEALLSLAS